MEEYIYKIIRIDEEDFGCEGRPEGQAPMVRVVLEADTGETMIVMMEDSLMYARKLDVGDSAILGADGMLYQPGTGMEIPEVSSVNFEKQAAWMENYWDALEELDETERSRATDGKIRESEAEIVIHSEVSVRADG